MAKGKRWTETEIEFLRRHYLLLTHKAIARKIGRSHVAVKAKAKLLVLVKPKFRFTPEQISQLRVRYADTHAQILADEFGCGLSTIHQKAHHLGLKKSIEFTREFSRQMMLDPQHGGRLTQFRKGQPAHNKGKKIGSHPNSAKTQFKKGQLSHNKMPVGTEKINCDGYWKIKIGEPNVWTEKHRLLWEQANGAIDVEKAETIAKVAQVVVNNSKNEVDFLKAVGGIGMGSGFFSPHSKEQKLLNE